MWAPLVGDPPDFENILKDPMKAWRVWRQTHRREYNEDSEVCTAEFAHDCVLCIP